MKPFLKIASICWGILVTITFIASFVSTEAATYAFFTRYIYVGVITGCAIGIALGIMHSSRLE